MKKTFYTILFAALLMGAVSCTELLDPKLQLVRQEIPEGATLTMSFGVPAAVPTKADMASDPTIESMHVFVFDAEGTLLQVRKATLGATVSQNYDASDLDESMISYWSVDNIQMSDEERHLHFVANLADNQIPTSGSETSIFQTLAVTAPNASYWQRIELNDILPYTYEGNKTYTFVDNNGVLKTENVPNPSDTPESDGSYTYTDANEFTVYKGDYIDHNANKIVNGTGYYYVPDNDSPLKDMVPLVRNFARIVFTNNWSSFTLTRIALGNVPKSGLVAPYDGDFADGYTSLVGSPAGTEPAVADLSDYTPLLPGDGIDTDLPTILNVSGNKATLFMYERGLPTPNANATCVLIGGNFTGNTTAATTWYKIEVTDKYGEYFPIYRDFTYPITLNSIDASAKKYTSAAAAWSAIPVGDISNSPETATLTQITDGEGLTLWVNYVDYPDLDGGTTVPLIYTFFYEGDDETIYFCSGDDDRVEFTRQKKSGSTLGWATAETVVKKGVISSTNNSGYLDKVPHDDYTWYLAEVTLNTKGDDILQSNIHVEGAVTSTDATGYAKKLSRDVTYTVMGQQKLGLKTSGLSADAAEKTTSVTITLPNTLGPAVFPLTLKIEAEDNNLTPTENLTVETGTSSFDADRNTYYFLKTISYTDYYNSETNTYTYTYTCNFKTTKATGKTPVTRIRVTQKTDGTSWFKDGTDATVALKVGQESTN